MAYCLRRSTDKNDKSYYFRIVKKYKSNFIKNLYNAGSKWENKIKKLQVNIDNGSVGF
jgi:hypothetical protein